MADAIFGLVIGMLACMNAYCVWQIIALNKRVTESERKGRGGRRKTD